MSDKVTMAIRWRLTPVRLPRTKDYPRRFRGARVLQVRFVDFPNGDRMTVWEVA